MAATPRYFECNSPGVIFEQFADETVVINLDSGHYYTLDAIGATLWERVTGAAALDDVVEEFRRDYDGDPAAIDASIREFVAQLLSEQLIRPVAGAESNGAAPSSAQARGPFSAPKLEKYDDMAEMLLLDPVHDVDAAGWPSAPAEPTTDAKARVETDNVSEWPGTKQKG